MSDMYKNYFLKSYIYIVVVLSFLAQNECSTAEHKRHPGKKFILTTDAKKLLSYK